jgi:DNA-binding GntR family transcriptional regulator
MAAPDKLVIQIVERIEDKIALGDYRPGDRLRQEQLAEEFCISRTPVSDGLRAWDQRL